MSPARKPGSVGGLRAAAVPGSLNMHAHNQTAPDSAAPAVTTLPRVKPVRVTLDLDPATYTALNRWLGTAAPEVDPDRPRLSLAQVLRAMIAATVDDRAVAAVVVDRLRRGVTG